MHGQLSRLRRLRWVRTLPRKGQDSDSGLQGGVGNDAEGNLCVGKHDKKSGSDTSSNNFFTPNLSFHFISLLIE